MKITAGLGSVDDYPMYVEAGADECFCGYVPFAWAEKYGVLNPLNRREVRAYNVQIGSYEELKILGNMRKYYQVPVAITFNSLSYTPEQYPVVGEIIGQCHQAGFDTIIVADPALLLYIRSQKIPCRIHLSGEFGEINSQMADFLEEMEICRVIFHRKNTVEDMKSCISNLKKNIEYEAFVLNELCHFSGGFCNSLHCDELGHLCRVPYRVGKLNKKCKGVLELSNQKADEVENEDLDVENYRTGAGGCGLCALYDLQKAGITYLKIVGRGNYTEFMQQDIIRLKKALMIGNSGNEKRIPGSYETGIVPRWVQSKLLLLTTVLTGIPESFDLIRS